MATCPVASAPVLVATPAQPAPVLMQPVQLEPANKSAAVVNKDSACVQDVSAISSSSEMHASVQIQCVEVEQTLRTVVVGVNAFVLDSVDAKRQGSQECNILEEFVSVLQMTVLHQVTMLCAVDKENVLGVCREGRPATVIVI